MGSIDHVNQDRMLIIIDQYSSVVKQEKYGGPSHSLFGKLLDDSMNLGPETNQLWARPEDMENIPDTMSTSSVHSRNIGKESMEYLECPIPMC